MLYEESEAFDQLYSACHTEEQWQKQGVGVKFRRGNQTMEPVFCLGVQGETEGQVMKCGRRQAGGKEIRKNGAKQG